MNLSVILLFVCFITIFITIQIIENGGFWNNIEKYTPTWSEKYLILSFFYIFIVLISICWIYNSLYLRNTSFRSLNNALFVIILILFFFSIFCLSNTPTPGTEEAFILSILILSFLLISTVISLLFAPAAGKIFSLVPLLLYLYLFIWIYEIKNNH